MLYNCCTGNPWTFTYTLNGVTSESNVFRIEALDEDDIYKLIYKIDGLNRTYSELYDENKIELFKSILKECS